jgi:hypothetical protein
MSRKARSIKKLKGRRYRIKACIDNRHPKVRFVCGDLHAGHFVLSNQKGGISRRKIENDCDFSIIPRPRPEEMDFGDKITFDPKHPAMPCRRIGMKKPIAENKSLRDRLFFAP